MTFIFPNSWDDDLQSDFHIFQRGWNHQLENFMIGRLKIKRYWQQRPVDLNILPLVSPEFEIRWWSQFWMKYCTMSLCYHVEATRKPWKVSKLIKHDSSVDLCSSVCVSSVFPRLEHSIVVGCPSMESLDVHLCQKTTLWQEDGRRARLWDASKRCYQSSSRCSSWTCRW